MQVPSDRKAKLRVWIAFLCLFVFIVALSIGAYYLADLGRLQDSIAARESQAAVQGITDPAQIDEALKQQPSNRFLQMVAMAITAANATNAATEKLSGEVEQPAIPADINLGAVNRSDLEALRRHLKTAEANALAFMPRYTALLKTERDTVEKNALALHVEKRHLGKLLEAIDKRHAEMTAFHLANDVGARRVLSRLRKLRRASSPGSSVPTRSWTVNSSSRFSARWTVTTSRPPP